MPMPEDGTTMMRPDVIIDVTGNACPVPIMRTLIALNKMKKGQILAVITDHPPSLKSIPEGIGERGHEHVNTEELNGYKKPTWRVLVRKLHE